MASSSSVPFRLISHIGFTVSSSYHCNLGKWTARSVPIYWFNRRGLTTTAPLLMLPPEFEDDRAQMSYKLYSPTENKVQTLSPSPTDVVRKLWLKCSGSSRGWLALLSPLNDDFFLYNPITHRQIKLPSIYNSLPRTPKYVSRSRPIRKLILSCSPDEDEENCRAVVYMGYAPPLAFCCPGRSKEWTLIWDEKRETSGGYYYDFVYSTRHKLFFGLTNNNNKGELETWDLRDPSSPRLINIVSTEMSSSDDYYTPAHVSPRLINIVRHHTPGRMYPRCLTKEHLVVANQDDLLLVIQYLLEHVGPDGSCFIDPADKRKPNICHHMTVDFEIFKYDPEKGSFDSSSSLGGLALFLGAHSDSVAIPATRFPGLKPNSVYFTDIRTEISCGNKEESFGTGYDIGIFSCEDRTVSPCYYPCDARSLKKILPAPMWFFPSYPI